VAEGDREGDLDRVFVATPFFLGVIIYIYRLTRAEKSQEQTVIGSWLCQKRIL
jgi:hypothetical protein